MSRDRCSAWLNSNLTSCFSTWFMVTGHLLWQLRIRGCTAFALLRQLRDFIRIKVVCLAQFGLFFGSVEGSTGAVAYRIQSRLGTEVVDIFDVAEVTQLVFADYDRFMLGIP